jgi:hypothetical protein
MEDYLNFWLGGGGSPEYYTFWIASSAWANYEVTGNASLLCTLYPKLVDNYWNRMYIPNFNEQYGCYWHLSDREGEENSVGGDGCRPVSNSVMYGEAVALGKMAALLGNTSAQQEWKAQATFWQRVVMEKLWSEELEFFVTLTVPKPNSTATRASLPHTAKRSSRKQFAVTEHTTPPPTSPGAQCPTKGQPHWPKGKQVTVREIMGLSSPWYFGVIPKTSFEKFVPSWKQVSDPNGFAAPFGPRTVELRTPCYNFTQFRSWSTRHECNWNGPSWPFETSKLLTGMASLLLDYPAQTSVKAADFMALLKLYVKQHTQGVAGMLVWEAFVETRRSVNRIL